MTVLCAKEFADACAFAAQADMAYAESIAPVDPRSEMGAKMAARRGAATASLLHCIGCLARWNVDYNESPDFPMNYRPETEIVYTTGRRRKVGENPDKAWLPRQETSLFSDMSPHSFFFREDWIDPETRQPVFVMDHLYYCFAYPGSRGLDQKAVDDLTLDDLHMKALNRECEVVWSKSEADARLTAGDIVRHVERQRRGLCGGIIYHADYVDGHQAPYGSWQIHT